MNRSEIFKAAWYYFKKGLFETFGDCQKKAWEYFKVKDCLKNGIVNFTYIKKSNSQIRKAVGTLKAEHFEYEFQGTNKKYNPEILKYYDLMRSAWRSFSIKNYVSIDV